jgi:vitamin B12 transporter
MIHKKLPVFILAILSSILLSASVFADVDISKVSEKELEFMRMYFTDEELGIVSATRSLKSINRVAENVEVVTADDIELMNAHTVSEALYFVTGIEMWNFTGPGANGYASIHGADYVRVTVLLDGVPIRGEQHDVMLGVLPVQMIEKIEIIKGPASSTWGSSFGGVINIITKSAGGGDHINGTAYASGGERNTSDVRAEFNGRKGPVGVYLFAGSLNSDGIVPGHEFWHNNLFTKLTLDAGQRTKIDMSFFYHKGDAVQWDYLPLDFDIYHAGDNEYIYGRAALTTEISPSVDLNLSAWMNFQNNLIYEFTGSDEELWEASSHYDTYGLNSSLTWRSGQHTIVAGTDILKAKFEWDLSPKDLTQWQYALFINDTIHMGAWGITPGLRYDYSDNWGDFLSPSLGITWQASKDLLLRASVSRGFHDPRMTDVNDSLDFKGNPDIDPETIWSYQIGAEANILNAFRAKVTLFIHDIDDILLDSESDGLLIRINAGKATTTGGELDISTREYKGFTLRGGFHYEKIEPDNYTSERAFDTTNAYSFNTAVAYKGKGLRAILQGHYMWWNLPGFWDAKYNGFIMDANIIKEIIKTESTTLEAFFTAHNILDSASYNDSWSKNPGRWIEGGLRYRF